MPEPATQSLDHLQLTVLGDVMLDRYWSCRFEVRHQEGVPRLNLGSEQLQPGGAANVAMSLAALGIRTTLFGLVGDDADAERLEAILTGAGVDCRLLRVSDHPTIVKLRIAESGQPLMRIDSERPFPQHAASRLLRHCLDHIAAEQSAGVVISDYLKGSVTDPATLIDAARAAGLTVVADTKATDWRPYRGVTCLTPNRDEFTSVAGPCDDDAALDRRIEQVAARMAPSALLVTLGEQGMLLARPGHATERIRDRAHAADPAIGAGDTALALLAAHLAAGEPLPRAARLANRGTTDAVRQAGEGTVCLASSRPGAIDGDAERALLLAIARSRAGGTRLVFTNGCFDLLHAGHLACLDEACGHGDRLVVAINDDDSVRHNKGAERPVQPLAERIAALQALDSVDWVIPFAEPTPERLIRAITPDVLVKGGDYAGRTIVGADWVVRHGGCVITTRYLEGFSTSAILASRAAGRVPPDTGVTYGASR